MRKIIYPGTFDPLTQGHRHIIERASALFDKIIVAIAADTTKQTLFAAKERLHLAQQCLSHVPQVEICLFHGLLADFAQQQQIKIILRGVRAVADFEYERQLASINQKLFSDLETLFILPLASYTHISASLVREIAALKGDVTNFVDEPVVKALKQKFSC